MKRYFLGAGLTLALCGCMSTRHVEETYHSTSVPDSQGSSTCCQQATHAERCWCGPWCVQPERAKP